MPSYKNLGKYPRLGSFFAVSSRAPKGRGDLGFEIASSAMLPRNDSEIFLDEKTAQKYVQLLKIIQKVRLNLF